MNYFVLPIKCAAKLLLFFDICKRNNKKAQKNALFSLFEVV